MTLKNKLIKYGAAVAFPLIILGGIRACNNAWNNKSIENPGYQTESKSLGLFGHTEFTRYYDGSYDVKTYPRLSHRYFDSQLDQDLNGDCLVDRIRQSGSEVRMNSLKKILTREKDYSTNRELFDKADSQLQDLIIKYPEKYLIANPKK
jgi:hypothetical protein